MQINDDITLSTDDKEWFGLIRDYSQLTGMAFDSIQSIVDCRDKFYADYGIVRRKPTGVCKVAIEFDSPDSMTAFMIRFSHGV